MDRRNLLKNIAFLPLTPLFGKANRISIGLADGGYLALHQSPFESIAELAPGVFFAKGKISFFQNGNYAEAACNNGWIVFNDFVVVIDANFPSAAAVLLNEIRKTTDKPIRYVFNTHHHGDHLYGNSFWAKQGAVCIAYTGVIKELQRIETGYYGSTPGRWEQVASKRNDLSHYPLLPPPITFTDKLVIEDQSKRLELLHLGTGHTAGDGIAWLAKEKILFAGDSCLNGPFNLFRDADVLSWIKTLDSMKALQPAVLIPGHGPLGDSQTISNQQAYFKVLYDWVSEKQQNGLSAKNLKENLPELRSLIAKDRDIKIYLIGEPEVVPGFSLAAQVLRILETILSTQSIKHGKKVSTTALHIRDGYAKSAGSRRRLEYKRS